MHSFRQRDPEPLGPPPVRVARFGQKVVHSAFQMPKARELCQHLDSEGYGALQCLGALREFTRPPDLEAEEAIQIGGDLDDVQI